MDRRMSRKTVAAALVALAGVSSVEAHHSQSMFDASAPIWVKGTVVSYAPIAPHAMIVLEETTADGRVQQWNIEGPFPGRLNRILVANGMSFDEAFFKPGDVIEVCGFDLREDLRARRQDPNPDGSTPKFAHGQMVVMPDGHMQSWGPYGKLTNCIRPGDAPGPWADFLNRDPLARGLWCSSRNLVKAVTLAAPEFVAAVNGRMTDPCP